MQPDSQKLLFDMGDAAKKILAFVRGKTLKDLLADDLLRSGVYWNFVVIGEAASQLRRSDEPTAAGIPECEKIVALRNQIVHGYGAIDNLIIWDIIEKKLPTLIAQVSKLSGD